MTFSAEIFCFFEHLLSKSPEQEIYCFVPGSTDQEYLETQLGRIEFISKVSLQNPQLPLTGLSSTKEKATFISHSQSFVEGAIYKINCIQLEILNRKKASSTSSSRLTLLPIKFYAFDLEPQTTPTSSAKGHLAKIIQKTENQRDLKTSKEALPLVSKL